MKKIFTKIAPFILIAIFLNACDAEKRVPSGKVLLTQNDIVVNGKTTKDESAYNQLVQKPNTAVLGLKIRLNLYNLANLNADSTFHAKFINNTRKYERMSKWLSAKQVDRLGKSFWNHGIHEFLKKNGESPVIIDASKTEKSRSKLRDYYFNNGYFNAKVSTAVDSLKPKRSKIVYQVKTGVGYALDSLKTAITSPALDSLYRTIKLNSAIKTGNQYKTADFEEEKSRITTLFRNTGVFNFQPNYVTFDIDTIQKANKANATLVIKDFSYQENETTKTKPFLIYNISGVNIYTDYSLGGKSQKITDSITFKNFNLFSHKKLKYRPKAITDAIFITKGALFGDEKTVLTTRYLNNLKIFGYPTIQYEVDKRDSLKNSLIAKIYLSPRKKYGFSTAIDATHSNIQNFGILFTPSLSIRNVFRGAETFEISARGSIGASKDLANPNNRFFNVSEYGIDLKLNFPRILMPFSTERIIPKSTIPSTVLSLGIARQTNIGLDKENVTGSYTYNWNPKKNQTARFDLFNVQFVRNLNQNNYFNVYQSSYSALNSIAKTYNTNNAYFDNSTDKNLIIQEGTSGFTNDVLSGSTSLIATDAEFKSVKSIEERRVRLTEDDYILATSFIFNKTTKKNLQDNSFYLFKTKIESAGSFLSLLSNTFNQTRNSNDKYEFLNLEYSEYIKAEFDYIKHWDFGREKIVALRTFFGLAIPFGNSNYIPFSRSYFSGGSNDNRAWQPYSLGPGSSGATNDFNEANMKIALSGEFRFKILGNLKGALFADAGNIWDVNDNITDEKSTFTSLNDLKDIALGSGFGFRYDFSFFVIRFDFGFKTYNPINDLGKKWLNDYNFGNSVLNFGINYPF